MKSKLREGYTLLSPDGPLARATPVEKIYLNSLSLCYFLINLMLAVVISFYGQ